MAKERTILSWPYRHRAIWLVLIGVMLSVFAQEAWAQRKADERMHHPTEVGVRFTPEMARAMARVYTKEMIVRRYELDESRVGEANEVIAKRLMELAHKLDAAGYRESLEGMVADIMEFQLDAEGRRGRRGPTPKFGQALAKGILPTLPAVREMIRGVGRDVRPMLSVGQQLKFGKDLLLAEATFDTFEKSMERWVKGEVRRGENPFMEDSGKIEIEEDGHSRAYNNAERIAERSVDRGEWTQWEKYVESAKSFYGFDDAQSAIADSILRECLDRVKAVTEQDRWRRKGRRNRVWFHMLWHLGIGHAHPLRYHIDSQYSQISDPVTRIGEDLKRRIDEIPTRVQRQEAEDRMLDILSDHGYYERSFEPEETQQPEKPSRGEETQDATGSEAGI